MKRKLCLEHQTPGWWVICPSDPAYYIEDCRISRDHRFEYHFKISELCIADGFCISYQIIGHIIFMLAKIRAVGMYENPRGANICHILQINHLVKGCWLLNRHAGRNAFPKHCNPVLDSWMYFDVVCILYISVVYALRWHISYLSDIYTYIYHTRPYLFFLKWTSITYYYYLLGGYSVII